MTNTEWIAFTNFREQFRTQTNEWNALFATELAPLQRNAATNDTPAYPIETSVVYNSALDNILPNDSIKLILVGDNPGKNEQLAINRKYLVGQAGKLGDGFFRTHPELNIDFRKNVLILNKTPIHTAKTAHLKYLEANGSDAIKELICESQIWMSKQTSKLHQTISQTNGQLWLVGYAELKSKGIFSLYRDTLLQAYGNSKNLHPAWEKVFVFQHFSMNRFSIDFNRFTTDYTQKTTEQSSPQNSETASTLATLGTLHRKEIFGI